MDSNKFRNRQLLCNDRVVQEAQEAQPQARGVQNQETGESTLY
jgi:hypothetical protein